MSSTIDQVLTDLEGLTVQQVSEVSTPTSQRLEHEAARRLGLLGT